MGLDMYLKTNARTGNKYATGACGGLFPLAPAMDKEETEIGYWRKNYKLDDYILNLLNTEDVDPNCVDFEVSEEDCQSIIDFAKEEQAILEEGGDDENGWYCVDDWKYTVKTFKKALRLIQQGFTVKYMCWY